MCGCAGDPGPQKPKAKTTSCGCDGAPARRRRDADLAIPPSSRQPGRPSYRFAVAVSLIRDHRIDEAAAIRMISDWEKYIRYRFKMAKSPESTAEHLVRFQRQRLARPHRDPSGEHRSRSSRSRAARDVTPRSEWANPKRKPCARGTEMQTIIFPADFDPRAAAAWAKRHGHRVRKIDRSPTTGSIRIRQQSPDRFVEDSFATIPLSRRRGIVGVIACPLPGKKTKRRRQPAAA